MTPDTANLIERIERDRRAHERDALVLLLGFFRKARQHAWSAIRVGADLFSAARDVILGNPSIEQGGLAAPLAEKMAAADDAGYHSTTLILPTDIVTPPLPAVVYATVAQQQAAQIAGTLTQRLVAAIAGGAGGNNGRRNAVADAFEGGGYSKNNPWLAETIAEKVICQSYAGGMHRGWLRPEAARILRGFEHVSVLDERTSDICNDHAGTRLPADDAFWLTSTPPLHFRCRSILRPLFDPFIASDYPTVPPAPGFGQASLFNRYWGQSGAA